MMIGLDPAAMRRVRATIDASLRDTPIRASRTLSGALGVELMVKDESVNRLGCFKGRGADAFVQAHRAELERGVVCASAGNFGLALADAARRHSVNATVFVAATANPLKIARIASTGATIVQGGEDFDAAKSRAAAHAEQHGLRYVEDGAEDAIALGAGTIAIESLEQFGALDFDPSAWLVPVGNGALVNGVGSYLKAMRPDLAIVGVVAAGAAVMRDCWRNPAFDASAARSDTIADGIAVRVPIPRAVELMRAVVDEVVCVVDEAMVEAMRLLHETTGRAAEPSAVAGIAALLQFPELRSHRRIATVLTGANLTAEQRSRWLGVATESTS